jgi:hypothetical protein
MKRKIFTLLLSAMFSTALMAQAVIMKATTAPIIDGVEDAVWADANVYNIAVPFQAEVATVGVAGETTWQALWDDAGIYVLLKVADDVFFPDYMNAATDSWMYDKPEIYFDCNYVLADGGGAGAGAGHYQVAPAFFAAALDGTPATDAGTGVVNAMMVADPTYMSEYFVPWSRLNDKDGISFDKLAPMGFDVTIIDRDDAGGTRQRIDWSNSGAINESWNNMDGCGTITFDGATAAVLVDAVTLTGGAITENNGTLQVVADITPADAANKNLIWKVTPVTGRATVSNKGVVSAIADGVVTITATAADGSYSEGSADVTISGQIVSANELNVIKNGTFVTDGGLPSPWAFWSGNGGVSPVVTDGVAVLAPVQAAVAGENWQYQFQQPNLQALPNIDYIFSFKAWSDVDRIINVDFESSATADLYVRYGTSTDPESNGSCDWTFGVTTVPTMYTFHVNFDKMIATTAQKLQFMIAHTSDVVYLDSVSLVSVADMGLVSTVVSVNSIAVTGAGGASTITVDKGTLQMSAAILPADATVQDVKWSVVTGTGTATIDAAGVLTPTSNGKVTVVASAKDDSNVTGSLEVTSSNQVVPELVLNVDMNAAGVAGRPVYIAGAIGGIYGTWAQPGSNAVNQMTDANSDGIYTITLSNVPNGEIAFKFFIGADWNTGDPVAGGDRKFTVNGSTTLNFVWNVPGITNVAQNLAPKVQVYPNPVDNSNLLNVTLSSANSKVSIYNSVGRKVEEVMVAGTKTTIDVSNYARGIYFVKVNDSVVKFVK